MPDFNSLKMDLLLRLKMGDEVAFKEIYLRYWKLLFHIAYKKVQSQEVAEEIVQNIFIDLWAQRKVKNIQNLKYYLTSAVRYSVINHVKNLLIQEKYST